MLVLGACNIYCYLSDLSNITNAENCVKLACWKVKYFEIMEKFVDTNDYKKSFIYSNLFTSNSIYLEKFVMKKSKELKYYTRKFSQKSDVVRVEQADICRAAEFIDKITVKDIWLKIATLGHDSTGSPATLSSKTKNKETWKCFVDLLNSDKVEYYFVSQHKSDFMHPKLRFAPIGLGIYALKSKLYWSDYKLLISNARKHHKKICSGGDSSSCHYNKVSLSIHTDHKIRKESLKKLHNLFGNATEIPNTYKLDYAREDSLSLWLFNTKSQFVWSPQGTHYDCWRHWESLYSATIPIIPDKLVLRKIFGKLPVIYIDFDNPNVTYEEISQQYNSIINGTLEELDLQRLSVDYWRNYISDCWDDKCRKEKWWWTPYTSLGN